VAAGRPSLRDRVQLVVSIGGHLDLPRVPTYLCPGIRADGTTRPPHDYGVAVMLLAAVDRVVPSQQVPALRDALVSYLEAASDDIVDPAGARRRVDALRPTAAALPDPSRTLMQQVLAHDVASLGRQLLPYVETLGGDAALSPSRSAAPAVPIFLLHGADDAVIPADETRRLSQALHVSDVASVRTLITPLVGHAELLPNARLADTWHLVAFWREVMRH
jgi:pimeloyl-ACP methyl ester carboxylesterase